MELLLGQTCWLLHMTTSTENPLYMVLVYDDDFLRRAGGSRLGGASTSQGTGDRKDSALTHYVGRFNHKKIIIFHKEFSPDNAKLPLFTFKVLSRYLGGHPVPLNAERVILVAKQFSLRVFGVGYGCQALRTPYYLSYAAQALAAGMEDVEDLDPYGKRMFMRAKKTMQQGAALLPPVDEEVPPQMQPQMQIVEVVEEIPSQMQIVEAEDDAEVERPPKKIKPSSSSPSPPRSDF